MHKLVYLLVSTGSGPRSSAYGGVPIAGLALCAEVGGSIIFVAFLEFTGFHLNAPGIFRSFCGSQVCPNWGGNHLCGLMPYVVALVGLPRLHGCYACLVNWAKGALQG